MSILGRRAFRLGVVVLAAWAVATPARSADGAISGTVTGPAGAPVTRARVSLIELHQAEFTDEEGRFRFEGLSNGLYHLEADRSGLGSEVVEVVVEDGTAEVELVLSQSAHREQIVVSATRTRRGTGESVHPVEVLDSVAVTEAMQPSIGETLAQQPGISATYFGPAASRPIIRGKGGGRIRILESGIGVGDASSVSPDHAVASDPFEAGRIEILRGPSTLLYGSSAVGGVVNVINDRIPEHAPSQVFAGNLSLRGGSVADERAGAVSIGGGVRAFAWKIEGFTRETGNYEIPGNAVRNDPDSPSGILPNSELETDGATIAASWVGSNGFVGGSVKRFESLYGIPVDVEALEGGSGDMGRGMAEQGGGVRIDMEQTRYDLKGGFETDWGRIGGLRFDIGATDYEHVELEADETGTVFKVDSAEGRLEIHHGESTSLPGVFGLQVASRDIEAVGEEAFLPPTDAALGSIFAHQEFSVDKKVKYEVGLRYEGSEYETTNVCEDGSPCATNAECAGIGDGLCRLDRSFDLVSGSAGLAYVPNESYTVAASISRSARAPSAEELYSNGPHLATATFELGDPSLDDEVNIGIDVSLRKRAGWLTGELSLYAQDFKGFIQEIPNGEEQDGLPVFVFTQTDAEFYGGEVQLTFGMIHSGAHDFDLELFGDLVRAEDKNLDERLPYIPPARFGVGASYGGRQWHAAAKVTYFDEVDRTAISLFDRAPTTPGYVLVDASVGYRLVAGKLVHQFLLRGTNLTDEEARRNPSRIRDQAPLPGADVNLSYRLYF